MNFLSGLEAEIFHILFGQTDKRSLWACWSASSISEMRRCSFITSMPRAVFLLKSFDKYYEHQYETDENSLPVTSKRDWKEIKEHRIKVVASGIRA